MTTILYLKITLVTICSLFIISCTHYIDNPYANVPKNQLRNINSSKLCSVVANSAYKISSNVNNELTTRGYKDCSESELYCRETLILTPGSTNFVNCRLARDQYNLNVQSQQIATFLALQQLQVQQQAIYTPRTINVIHSGTVNVNHSGYINNYMY